MVGYKVFQKFGTVVHILTIVVSWIARIASITMVLLLTADVFLRNFFDVAIRGTVDLIGLATVLLASCSIAYTASDRSHLVITTITSRFPVRARMVTGSVVYLFGLVFTSLVTWRMYVRAADEMSLIVGPQTPMLEVPFFPFMFIAAVGFFLLSLELFVSLLEYIIKAKLKQYNMASPPSGTSEAVI